VAEVKLTIGAVIDGLKKGLEEAKGYVASFAGWVKKHESEIKKVRLESGIAFAAEIVAIRDVVKAYAESEQANIKLAQAMKARGIYTEELFKQTVASADAMMRLTTFDDEAIKGAQAMLVALANLTGNGLERATKATLDLAQAKELDLSTAAIMVARAINGDTDSIVRFIKVNMDGMDASQRFEAVLEALSKTVGGQAQAATAGTGALKQLNNIYVELKESLGSALIPILSDLAKWLSDIIPKMQSWVEENKKLVAILAGGGVAGTGLILLLAQFALAFSNPVTGIIAVVGLAAIGLAALVIQFKDMQKVQSTLPTTLEGTNKQISEFSKKLADARDKLSSALPGGDRAMLEVKKQWERDIKAYEEYLAQLYALRKQQTDAFNADIMAKAKSNTGAGEPNAPSGTGGPSGEEPAWLTEMLFRAEMERQSGEEIFAMHEEMDEKEWDRARTQADRIIAEQRRQQDIQQQLALSFLHNYANVFMTSFQGILENSKVFGKSLALCILDTFIGIIQMAIDASMNELLVKYVAENGKLTIQAIAGDLSALGRIGLIAAAYGAAKAGLNAVAGAARNSMAGSIPKYEYGGVVPETGLALVHKGEHIWNPQHPGSGSAPVFQYNHYGDFQTQSQIKQAIRDFEEAFISGQMRRRLA
jgi:hypothetical protein